jgi:hypothetical protein
MPFTSFDLDNVVFKLESALTQASSIGYRRFTATHTLVGRPVAVNTKGLLQVRSFRASDGTVASLYLTFLDETRIKLLASWETGGIISHMTIVADQSIALAAFSATGLFDLFLSAS